MARVNRIDKCRKEQKCSKCGKIIEVGRPYLKATPFHRPAIIRCTECGLRSWETSGSEFVQTCGRISDFWQDDYGTDYESLKSDLEELRDTCQDSLDNMPEQLQYSPYSPSGEILREQIDMLEDVINELDNIDEESLREEADEEYRNENDIEQYDANDNEISLTQEQEEEVDNLRDDKIKDAIEEALSGLYY